jgi:hypothetical protein
MKAELLAAMLAVGMAQAEPYVGSQVCAGCHAAIARTQEASHHAVSMRPLAEVAALRSHDPFLWKDSASGTEVLWLGSALVARRDKAEERLPLLWAFGGGSKGITPVGRLPDGEFVESEMSWFQSDSTFDLTPGAENRKPTDLRAWLGKALSDEDRMKCLGCHTSNIGSAKLPTRNQMGIHCERCHGPGEDHLRAVQHLPAADKRILNPGKLDALAQAQLCGACHGRLPAETDFVTIRLIRQTPAAARFPGQRLSLSRCFLESESGIKCTACHNPHEDLARGPERYDRACVGCHQQRTCSVGKEKCSSCHMPEEPVLRRLRFTDHWIRIVRKG